MTSDDIVRGNVQPVGSATDGDTNIDGKGRPTAVNPWRAPGAQTAAPTAATPDATTGMHDAGQLPPTNKVQVAPRRATSYEEYQRLLQEEQQMLGQTRTDSRGRTYTGRDAVEDKNGRLRTGANALLDGLSMAGPQGDGRYGWGELAGDLARMAGMFVGGTINKRYDEKRDFDKKLAQNRQQQEVAGNAAIFDQKKEKADADLAETQQKTINEAIKPLLDTWMKSDQITDAQAKILQQLTGLPYSAADWAERYRTERGGVTYVGKKSDDKLKPDTSLPIDQTQVPHSRTVDGQKFTVTDPQAMTAQVGIENANATRDVGIAKTNAEIANDNAQADVDFKVDAGKKGETRGTKQAAIRANNTLLDTYESANRDLQDQINSLDPQDNKTEIANLRAKINDNKIQSGKVKADSVRLQGEIDSMSAPVHKAKKTPISVNSRRGGSYSNADIESMIHK